MSTEPDDPDGEAGQNLGDVGIKTLRRKDLVHLDVRESVQHAFSERLQGRLHRSVWNSGCQSWYLKNGRNSSIWPGFTFAYWWHARRLRLDDFEAVAWPAAERLPEVAPVLAV